MNKSIEKLMDIAKGTVTSEAKTRTKVEKKARTSTTPSFAKFFDDEESEESEADTGQSEETNTVADNAQPKHSGLAGDTKEVVPASISQQTIDEIRDEIVKHGGFVGDRLRHHVASDESLTVYFAGVTPQLAKYWLEVRNTENYRSVRPPNLRRLTATMQDNRYDDYLGDPLKFTPSGYLSDGQHRLIASMASNTSHTFMIVHGVSHTVKDGKAAPKTLTDTLKLQKVLNAGMVSALLRALWSFNASGVYQTSRNTSVSDDQLLDVFYQNREQVTHFASVSKNGSYCTATSLSTFAFLTDMIEPGYGDYAVNIMRGKRTPPAKDPLSLAALRFRAPKRQGQRVSREWELGLLIKAWNLHRSNRTVQSLAYRPTGSRAEDFPAIMDFKKVSGVSY